MYMHVQYGSLQQLGLDSHCPQHLSLDMQSLLVLAPGCMSRQSLCSGPAAGTDSVTQGHEHTCTYRSPSSWLCTSSSSGSWSCILSLPWCFTPRDTLVSQSTPRPPVSPAAGWVSPGPCECHLPWRPHPWGHSWLPGQFTWCLLALAE